MKRFTFISHRIIEAYDEVSAISIAVIFDHEKKLCIDVIPGDRVTVPDGTTADSLDDLINDRSN